MTPDYAITPFFPQNQPFGTPVQIHHKPVYNYSLTMVDEKTVRIYRQSVGSKENKEMVCEAQLAGNFKATGIEKSYGDRFYFILENCDLIKKRGKWRQRAPVNELYCFGLQKGLIDFICGKFNNVQFSENYVALYDTRGLSRRDNSMTLYSLGAAVNLKGPYSFSSNRKYASMLPLLSEEFDFPPNPLVRLNEQERMLVIMSNHDIFRSFYFP